MFVINTRRICSQYHHVKRVYICNSPNQLLDQVLFECFWVRFQLIHYNYIAQKEMLEAKTLFLDPIDMEMYFRITKGNFSF